MTTNWKTQLIRYQFTGNFKGKSLIFSFLDSLKVMIRVLCKERTRVLVELNQLEEMRGEAGQVSTEDHRDFGGVF